MFFVSGYMYHIHLYIDGVSSHVMLESLPIHNMWFCAFKIINLDCIGEVDFFDTVRSSHLESNLPGENLK